MKETSPLAPKALALWRAGHTRERIASMLGITVGWTYDLIRDAKHRKGLDGFCTLSPRAEQFVYRVFKANYNVTGLKSVLRGAIERRDITDRSHRNVGKKTFEELCEWCGYKRPIFKSKPRKVSDER